MQGHLAPASHQERALARQAHSLSPSPATVSLPLLGQTPHGPAARPPCWHRDAPTRCAQLLISLGRSAPRTVSTTALLPRPVPHTPGCVSPCQSWFPNSESLLPPARQTYSSVPWRGVSACLATVAQLGSRPPLKLPFRPMGCNHASPLIRVLTSESRPTAKLVLPWKLSLSRRVFLSVL